MTKKTIKVAIFDLAEVVLQGILGVDEVLSHKLNLPAQEINKALDIPALTELFQGKITEDEYLEAVLKNTKWQISKNGLRKIIRQNFVEIPGTSKIIQELKKKYKVVVLSVHAREWIEYCQKKFGLDKLFEDGMFFSYEMEGKKPEKKAFLEVLSNVRAHPEEVLFIDDSEVNVQAARSLGIHAIQFESAGQLEKELKSLKLL